MMWMMKVIHFNLGLSDPRLLFTVVGLFDRECSILMKRQKKLADHDIFLTAVGSLVLGLKLEHKNSIATADLSFFLVVLDCAPLITLEELLQAERQLLLDLNFKLLSST